MSKFSLNESDKIASTIIAWLKEKATEAGAVGGIVGLSGGIDSAVVAALLKLAFGDDMLVVKMPVHSMKVDDEHADLMIEKFGLPSALVDLGPTFDRITKDISGVQSLSDMASANIKPRLRMVTLYALGQTNNYLVCGTSNKSEIVVGYYTKHGDSGVDLLPIADLTKTQVRELARFLGVPGVIIDKPPTAGLWEGQTDEEEMGVSYQDIDGYINGEDIPQGAREIIERRERANMHKRTTPAVCKVNG